MSRIAEIRFSNRLVVVEMHEGSNAYSILVQTGDNQNIAETILVSHDPNAVIATLIAICKTLELLHLQPTNEDEE